MTTTKPLTVKLTRSGKKVVAVTLSRPGRILGFGGAKATLQVETKPELPEEPRLYIPDEVVQSLALTDRDELRRVLFGAAEDFRPVMYWPATKPPPVAEPAVTA